MIARPYYTAPAEPAATAADALQRAIEALCGAVRSTLEAIPRGPTELSDRGSQTYQRSAIDCAYLQLGNALGALSRWEELR